MHNVIRRGGASLAALLLCIPVAFANVVVAPVVSDFAIASAPPSTGIDWDPLINALVLVLTSIVIPWAIVAYQRRTGVAVTDQQRAAIYHALDTAAAAVETEIDKGHLTVADLSPDHRTVIQATQTALDRVPVAAAAQNVTLDAATQIVAARVDTTNRYPVSPLSAPAA